MQSNYEKWLPLSEAQTSRWFQYKLDKSSQGLHNIVFTVNLDKPIELSRLEAAMTLLATRHPVLTAQFTEIDGTPYQKYDLNRPFEITQSLESSDEASLIEKVLLDSKLPVDIDNFSGIKVHQYIRENGTSVLLLAFEHLVSDGWSFWNHLNELDELLTLNEPGQWCQQSMNCKDYSEYTQWQTQWLSSDKSEKQRKYWLSQLAGEIPELDFPVDPLINQSQNFADVSNTFSFTIPTELVDLLKDYTELHSLNINTILLGAYQLLLSKYCNQNKFVIGCPMPGRTEREWGQTAGDFVNPVSIVADIDKTESIIAFLKGIKRKLLRGLLNQDYPFSLLVEELQVQRGSDVHPIFQTLFTFQNARAGSKLTQLWNPENNDTIAWGGAQVSYFPAQFNTGAGHFAIELETLEIGKTIRCDFNFNRNKIATNQIEALSKYYLEILSLICRVDTSLISDIKLASQKVVKVQTGLKTNNCFIHQLVENTAIFHGEKVAVVDQNQSITYQRLNERANQFAHMLAQSGLCPEKKVAVCLNKSTDLIVSILAILKVGATYIPIDPKLPTKRIEYIVSDSQPSVLVTQADLVAHFPTIDESNTYLIDQEFEQRLANYPLKSFICESLDMSSLAYIIYTSGSTGKPKGVMIEHKSLTSFTLGHIKACQLSESDNVLLFASIGFDASIGEIFPTLVTGAKLILKPEEVLIPDDLFISLLTKHQITVSDLPTAFWHLWIEELRQHRRQPNKELRLVIGGGEKAKQQYLKDWLIYSNNISWLNTYGPTEGTVSVTEALYSKITDITYDTVSLGQASQSATIFILNQDNEHVLDGAVGELCIAGANVARGYLNQPELTQEKFITIPEYSNTTIYKTGDLVRKLPDGTIDYLGRNDSQIKIRGFRVELGEIETEIGAFTGVKQVVVSVMSDKNNQSFLVAFIVGFPDKSIDLNTLKINLKHQLAYYMVPSYFQIVESIPLNHSGKIDQVNLRKLFVKPSDKHSPETFKTDTERTLALIWQDVLSTSGITPATNFFELGGHSLVALKVITAIQAKLRVDLKVVDIFELPILCELAHYIDSLSTIDVKPIEVADRKQTLPLSFAQQRLWFLQQLDEKASSAYNMPAALALRGVLNREALSLALNALLARHESLRTRFVEHDGIPEQVISPVGTLFDLTETDLSASPTAQAELIQRQKVQAHTPFDLSSDTLVRAELVRLKENEHTLLITFHHIITDGWSISLFVEELSALYQAFNQGKPSPLTPLSIQYVDYANWEQGWLQGDVLKKHTTFWQDYLTDAPSLLTLPLDKPRPAKPSYQGKDVRFTLSHQLQRSLTTLSQRHGTTLFMILLSAWGHLLGRLSGQDEVVIGTPVANRQHPDLEPLIGLFVNTLPVRVQCNRTDDVQQALSHIKQQTLSAFEHQALQFDQIVELSAPTRSLSYNPLVQVMFSLDQMAQDQVLSLDGLSVTRLPGSDDAAQFDMSLVLQESEQGLVGQLRYATDLFEHDSMTRLVGYFERMLTAMVEDETQVLSQISLLSLAEQEVVVKQFNDNHTELPEGVLIHQRFEQYAQATPDAIALRFKGQSMSYRTLNEQANQLAHHLLSMGLKPEQCVAVSTDRSLEHIVSLLAILKAGGAYLPIDASYPVERVNYILDDAKPIALLTTHALKEKCGDISLPVMCMDNQFEGLCASYSTENIDTETTRLTERHLANIIYTSGSTGLPKGVMVEHRNVIQLVVNEPSVVISAQDNVVYCANPAFDASTWEIWLALLNGAKLVITPQESLLNAQDFGALLRDEQASIVQLTVGLFNQYAQALAKEFSQLNYLLFGGDQASVSVVKSVYKHSRPRHLVHTYGPTESVAFTTTFEVNDEILTAQHLPIGRGIANSQIYILDEYLAPCPVGSAGEIYIGGAGVTRGYLNRSELTQERFITDPFSEDKAAHLYKTGDLGRWNREGQVEFLGRNDFQVKIRGFRVELGEIEHYLVACDGVDKAIVLAQGEGGDKRLVAYVIGKDKEHALDVSVIRSQLSEQLAQYMIPSAIVVMETFPLTANGKLDRRALPVPSDDDLSTCVYVKPEGEVEEAIAHIWQALLNVERVGRYDDFFALGGHSLLAVQMSAQIKQSLQIELSLMDLFETPVLADLSDKAVSKQIAQLMTDEDLVSLNEELADLTEEELLALLEAEEAANE